MHAQSYGENSKRIGFRGEDSFLFQYPDGINDIPYHTLFESLYNLHAFSTVKINESTSTGSNQRM